MLLLLWFGWSLSSARPQKASAADAKTAETVSQPTLFNTPEADAIVARMQIFPADNAWNTDVSQWPIHPDSAAIVKSIGADKPLRGNTDMAYVLVPADQKPIDVKITEYKAESDPGPYPLPDNCPVEGWPAGFHRDPATKNYTLDEAQRDKLKQGGDRHAIVVDPAHHRLYEFGELKKTDAGWTAIQASIFDLASNQTRPAGWTSTDAAGLPLFPAIVRYDELQRGEVRHAMRVTVRHSRHAYVAPATHYASRLTDKNLPRMGERLRLKADYDISKFSPPVQAILKGLKKYGMLVADNGIEWAISIAPDERIPELHDELRKVKGSAFEVVTAPK
ncbi:MAG TPA: hypothetical protein VFE24_09590 [Pirellulales bacterium]|nr:hypothetical protein [Pirellulales bacterium]